MGSSGNWFKLFIHHRKTNPNDQEKVLCGKRNKKWKLWRSSSSSESSKDSKSSVNRVQVAASESSELPAVDDVYSAAMATLVRAPPKDFLVIRQEWAAIRIQTAFRALLARRALRALKGIVRLQAVVRGWLVRKQAAMTLKCMQALVRAQAQVKAHRVKMSLEESSVQKTVDNQSDLVKQEEGKWCDSRGSIEEVKTKQQMRQEAAMKRERAMAYFISQQQLRASPNIKNNSEWSWLQGWMASKKTSESRKIESSSRKNSKTKATSSNSCCSSSSQMSSRVMNTESSFSSSTAFEATEDSASSGSVSLSKPRYMNLTASNKAKQREGISKSRVREEARNYVKSGLRFSGEVTRNSVDSAPCSNVVRSEESSLNRHDWIRCR